MLRGRRCARALHELGHLGRHRDHHLEEGGGEDASDYLNSLPLEERRGAGQVYMPLPTSCFVAMDLPQLWQRRTSTQVPRGHDTT